MKHSHLFSPIQKRSHQRRSRFSNSCNNIQKQNKSNRTMQIHLVFLSIIFILAASSNAFQLIPSITTSRGRSPLSRNEVSLPGLQSSASKSSAGENSNNVQQSKKATQSSSQPTCFREAEVLGLRYMQNGRYEEALKCETFFFISLF